MKNMMIKIMWEYIWKKRQKRKAANNRSLKPASGYECMVAISDAVEKRTEANVCTHKVVYLKQHENGKITAGEVLGRLYSKSKLKICKDGKDIALEKLLSTIDVKPGIAEYTIDCEGINYEIVFVETEIYSEYSEKIAISGGILNGEYEFSEDVTINKNVIFTQPVTVKKGIKLTIANGQTMTAKKISIFGELNGAVIGNVDLYKGALFNGGTYAGNMHVMGDCRVVGMFVGQEVYVEPDVIFTMTGCGMLVENMYFGDRSTLILEGAEPITCGYNPDKWYVDPDHETSDMENGGWYLTFSDTPTDILGREWTPKLENAGLLRPDVNMEGEDGMGCVIVGKDTSVIGREGTKNYAVMLYNRPFDHVKGYVSMTTNQGYLYSKMDAANLTIFWDNSCTKDKDIIFKEKVKDYSYETTIETTLQALTSPMVSKKCPGMQWRFAECKEGYAWYAYQDFSDFEHWHGPNGAEAMTILLKPQY